MALRTVINVQLQSELYNFVVNDHQLMICPGMTTWGDQPFKWYYYDVNSSATDDGELVIKPTSVMGNGRWLRVDSSQTLANWTASVGLGVIQNKPSLATVATTGVYNDLAGKPTIPAAQVNCDWNASSGITQVLNKPILKKQEAFSGTTNGSGVYAVTFGAAYSVAPNIQANIIGATDTQNIRITAISTTGFTVLVRNRTDVIGLLPTYSNVSGASVDVLITEK